MDVLEPLQLVEFRVDRGGAFAQPAEDVLFFLGVVQCHGEVPRVVKDGPHLCRSAAMSCARAWTSR
jgi:hypothetical protein